jgi:hypothetical protein
MNVIVSSRGLHEATCVGYTTAWDALVSWLQQCSKSVEHNQKAIPLISFAHFNGGIQKAHVQSVTAVMLDYDGATHDELCTVVTHAQAFRGFAYTTYNHTLKGDPPARFRVCLAIDRPVPPSAWELVWHRVGRILGVLSDKAPDRKTRDEGRFFFIPAQNPAGPPVWFQAWDGPPLNLDTLLAPDPNGESGMPAIIECELEQSELVSLFDINQLAKSLALKKSPDHKMLGRALAAALRGEVFAADGNRNDVCYKLAGELAKAFPKANAENLAERFQAAFDLQGEPTVEVFAGQIKRQQLKHQQLQREKRGLAQMRAPANLLASEVLGIDVPPANSIIEGLPLIVQKDGFYWCREPDSADYREVYGSRDIRLAIQRKYHQALDLYTDDQKPKPLDALLLEYSNVVRSVDANYNAKENSYDPASAHLTLATAPRRALQAKFHPAIDTWLRLLGGDSPDDVCDWIRSIFRLELPSPALYLWGQSGAGKTLLAYGLARIWEHPLTNFATVLESFNSGLARNPLVLADEGFPPETKFTWLRSFLSTSARDVNEKFRPQYTLRGHVRLVVTANAPNAFEFGRKALTAQDAVAIGERVIQLEVGADARRYLENIARTVDIEAQWVQGNMIAEHALWLATQPLTTEPGRWAVVSKNRKNGFESHLIEERYSWFTAWLAGYMSQPKRIEGRYPTGNPDSWFVRTDAGKLLVSPDAYRYLDRCEPGEFKKALKFFAPSHTKQMRVPGNPHRIVNYRVIDIDRFFNCAQDYVDIDTLLGTLGTDSKQRMGV